MRCGRPWGRFSRSPSALRARPSVATLKSEPFPSPLGDQLPPPFGAAAGQHLAAVLGRHACPEPVRALAAQLARLIGTLHRGSRGSVGVPKRGGKAKPLTAKVSIFLSVHESSAQASKGIDSAALSPSKWSRRQPRGSVALDSVQVRLGGRAPGAAVQYLGAAASGARGRRRAQAP